MLIEGAVMMDCELLVSVQAGDGEALRRSFPRGLGVLIGRDPGCHLVLTGLNVSRRHLSLELDDDAIVASDLSANGTLVNGGVLKNASLRITEGKLSGAIGHYRLEVEVRERESVRAEVRRKIHATLLENLRLHERSPGAEPSAELRREVIDELRAIVRRPEWGMRPLLQGKLVRDLTDEVLGLGAIEPLLADPEVSEVMVVDASTIYVERAGRVELTGRRFTDDESVRAVIERIVTPLGRRIDESSPLVDARLADGSRVNAVIPPLALRGPCITIRKFPSRRLELSDLLSGGALSEAMARFLTASVQMRKNIVISGGTGSGKTTLLNVLAEAIDPAERVVTIEDAAELSLPQPHVVKLESKPPNLEGRGEFTIRDLVKNALRMRPDRIVVGECRGGEAIDMMAAMNTGHEGSMTTTHANSPTQAIARLETLCLMGGLELPLFAIRRQIASSVNLVIQQSRLSSGARLVTSIAEVVGLGDDGSVEMRELFAHRDGAHQPTGYTPSFLEELVKHQRARGDGEAF